MPKMLRLSFGMDHFDNPSTRDRAFANAEKPAEPSDPDAATSASAEAPAAEAVPALEDSIRNLDKPIDNPQEDARLEKIANIKKALADGTYNVSAEELARKLIEHMLEP
jgi:flagellar biosynthesis anti-sigma factor FlgM